MSSFLLWLAATIACLLLFALLLILGIVRKKVNLIVAAVACFLLFMGAGAVAGYKAVRGTMKVAAEVAERRSGEQIYADILGQHSSECVKIYAASDPIIPTLGDPTSICFSSCPAEVNRILQTGRYEIVKRSTADLALNAEQCCDNYFSYARFGDTLLECIAPGQNGQVCTVWFSADSTHGFLESRKLR